MFEIKSAIQADSRQKNATNKALTQRPEFIQTTRDTYRVESTSGYIGKYYTVRFYRSDDRVFATCECEAGKNGNPCYHVMRAYKGSYELNLAQTGAQLLSNKIMQVGNLGTVGSPRANSGQVINLATGQTFTANVPVRLVIEPA